VAAPKILSGARAKVGIHDPVTGETKVIGTFNSISYHVTYDVQPAYGLGSYTPYEIDYTAVSPVAITCNGWRTLGHGPHVDAKLPKVQDLLQHQYLEMEITDRQLEEQGAQDARVSVIRYVRPTGVTGGMTNRQLSEQTATYVGILADVPDEGVQNHEGPSAATLP
jgi:hypothetical protein